MSGISRIPTDSLTEALETNLAQACRYAGVLSYFYEKPKITWQIEHVKHLSSLHDLIENMFYCAVLCATRSVEGEAPLPSMFASHNGEEWINLREKFDTLKNDISMQEWKVVRAELIAHDTWRQGSRERLRYERNNPNTPYLAPRRLGIIAPLKGIAQLCDEGRELLGRPSKNVPLAVETFMLEADDLWNAWNRCETKEFPR